MRVLYDVFSSRSSGRGMGVLLRVTYDHKVTHHPLVIHLVQGKRIKVSM